jgi:hypothetical protein
LDLLVYYANNLSNDLKEILIEDITVFLKNLEKESNLDEDLQSRIKIYEYYLSKLSKNEFQNNLDREHNHQQTKALKNKINKTLIVFNSKCTLHGEFPDSNPISRIKRREMQVENPDRINVLFQPPFGVLLSDFCLERFAFRESPEPACLADILRVHDFNYIEKIFKFCSKLKIENKMDCFKYDSDTYINQHSWDSAIHAAGCVIDAVDQIMKKDDPIENYLNAFCMVRPPGHHAGYFGRVE